MRIIAGKFKGKKLNTFELASTRPTSDKIREALFDKLGGAVFGSIFLDLFAGTGACGIEAISRGASEVCFVDSNADAIKIINKNLALIGETGKNVSKLNFDVALKNFAKNGKTFDIVFLDPPYKTDFAEKAILLLKDLKLLGENSIVVWEHDTTKLKHIKSNFENATTKKYGDKFLTYLLYNDIINIH